MASGSPCIFCKETKRKCDTLKPSCSNCLQYKQICDYHIINPSPSSDSNNSSNTDRRRRKYHTDYIQSLENDSLNLTKFIIEYINDEPELREAFKNKLSSLNDLPEEQQHLESTSTNDFNELSEILEGTEKLSLESKISPIPFVTELDEALFNTSSISGISHESVPISISTEKNELIIREPNYQLYILKLFKQNFAIHSPPLIKLVAYFETLDYNAEGIPPTQKLLFNTILGIGNVYSSHKDKEYHELYFMSVAKDAVMNVICKTKVDIYSITSLFLLSAYEFSQNRNSQSYVFDSISCSLTQHMGLHISYDNSIDAPKQTPFNLAILWSVIAQDRIVTGLLNVPCILHFKRIISPFYQVVTDSSNPYHASELYFSYNTRLLYIHDRFSDQILTTNFDVGDTNNKAKLLSMGLRILKDLVESLPVKLRLSSLDGSKDDFYILLFHFNYEILLIKLNLLFIKDNNATAAIKRSIISSTIEAARFLRLLSEREDFLPRYPYNSPHSIHLVGSVLFFLLINNKEIHESDKLSFHFQIVKNTLKGLSKYWGSAIQLFNILEKLSLENNISTRSVVEPPSDLLPIGENADFSFMFDQYDLQFPLFDELSAQLFDAEDGVGLNSEVEIRNDFNYPVGEGLK